MIQKWADYRILADWNLLFIDYRTTIITIYIFGAHFMSDEWY